ncbi:MAG TPA: hypothetical protein PL048_09700 [Leptospiraceae bacterium]|nr:hypothetical protein [Leptospiraceae bacterium]HMZ59038.1 hypothetical protein [Leptospiraceae bacterium]HNF14785.1 hypothetical protein [Leptospiraceae bacterium]HNI97357.1 hypothetical protein [Leptospiraceae bacterium]HNM03756.1 hypothetical protein [Leptospiraceae bacterium]
MSILIYISLLFLPYLLQQGTHKIQTVTVHLKGSEKKGKREVRFNPVNWRVHQKQMEPIETLCTEKEELIGIVLNGTGEGYQYTCLISEGDEAKN